MAVEAKRPVHTHLSEEAVENYAIGRLAKAQLAAFEEHLLLCEHCQERLDEEDDFAEAMRSLTGMEDAAPPSPDSLPPSPSPTPRRGPWYWISPVGDRLARKHLISREWTTLPWVAAFMLAVAISIEGISVGTGIVAWKLPLVWTSAGEAAAVTLTTLRGGDGDGMAQARALGPLDLAIQVQSEARGEPPSDVSESGSSLRETDLYRLEMVDAAGDLQWTGTARAVSGKLAARVDKRLRAGVYWVRLYAPSGKLLREFGLRVSK
jgi:hypothetical protein